ncbi:hypothetical protein SAMN02745172_04360 [Pseudoxanthobacter soli DSM 19599]|uniref:Alpha/beta hydrolase family protein n=2 Tax=Pseudoxanthobacter TaxID=433838 RepID=A0A1M7ZS94_9HYPH|nr:hypothetical protein SAMN02745172_04360 [Pseudoxanthobacter soli DSM 19599]
MPPQLTEALLTPVGAVLGVWMMGRSDILAALVAALGLMVAPACALARAAEPASAAIPSGVSYELIGGLNVDQLNTILTVDAPAFFGVPITAKPARNGVKLYRITYPSVVPELDNRPIVATGLLAVPDTEGSVFPLVSYQHGTVYKKTEVPSFPQESEETKLMIAQFAGQGYLLIGPDYFGMGASTEPEGYGVMGSQQQASFDMLTASLAVLRQLKISNDKLFISGWSEGGFVTMAFLQRLERAGVKVDAAATASAPADIYSLLNGFLNFPRKNDATWANVLYILSAFSFENYYRIPGLARTIIAPEYYDLAKRVYERQDYKKDEIPTNLKILIQPAYFDPEFFAQSAYGRIALATQAYRWIIKTPLRNYYGEDDEIVSVGLGRLVMEYQRGIGAGNSRVEAISTGPTNHRGTFATAVPRWKEWFDTK